MKRLVLTRSIIRLALFLAVPVVSLELAGLALAWHFGPNAWWSGRMGVDNVWLGPAGPASDGKIDFLFVGTSRTAAAVDADAFVAGLPGGGAPRRALNLRMGYSAIAEHFLVLRHLYSSNPAGLKGCTVFIEAPDGLPDSSTPFDSWVHPATPNFIVPLLTPSDLPKLLIRSGTPVGLKARIAALRLSTTIRAIWAMRESIWKLGNWSRGMGAHSAQADLTSAGGILTDLGAVEATRQIATSAAASAMLGQVAVRDWRASFLFRIGELVRRNGGKLVVFTVPMSSVEQRPRRTKIRIEDKQTFRKAAFEEGITVLEPPFRTRDEDFPDLFHLRRSLAPEFSRCLAAAYLEAGKMPPPKPIAPASTR